MNKAQGLPIPDHPEWLGLLPDHAGEAVSMRVERQLTRISIALRNGQSRTVYLKQDGDLRCWYRDRRGQDWQPCPNQSPAAVASFFAARQRAAWVQSTLLREYAGGAGAPPPDHALQLAQEYARLKLAQAKSEASTPMPRDAQRGALEVYFALLAKDWQAVFAAEEATPAWLRPVVFALSGNLAGLRAAAAALPESPDPLAVFKGLTLDRLGYPAAAFETLKVGLAALDPQARAIHYVPFASVAAECGHQKLAASCLAWAANTRRDDDRLLARVTTELLRLGAFAEAARGLEVRAKREPGDLRTFVSLADLALWTGHLDMARSWIERARQLAPEDFAVLRLDAVSTAFSKDRAAAIKLLEDPRLSSCDETLTWLAELLTPDDPVQANDVLSRAKAQSQTPVHTLIQYLIDGETSSPTALALLAKYGDPALDGLAQIPAVMRAFQGNRGRRTTRTPTPEPSGPGDLIRVKLQGDVEVKARDAAASILKQIRSESLDTLHARFRRLTEEYPASPHPHCYWGELRLWLGEFDEAEACFNEPVACTARWAFVGRAAVHVHRGDPAAALREFKACAKRFEPVHGATTHVYLGELYRLRGDYERAKSELQIALSAKPQRLGARLNQYLCWLHTGRAPEALEGMGRVHRHFPWLTRECERALGLAHQPRPSEDRERLEATCLQMLRLMRGNRSSHTVTFFDTAGQLRIAQDASRWHEFVRNHVELVEHSLLRQLMAGT